MTDCGAPPQDAAKWGGDHRCSRWLRIEYRCRNMRACAGGNHMPAAAAVVGGCRRPSVSSGAVLVRYRYRLRPTRGQQMRLARVFGCARVVYNDSLRLREQSHAAGEKVSDSEVQRRVITLAKFTPEREWLAGVSSVALVQACNDARRAYRNRFDSLAGRRKGRKVGHPVFRRKHGRQSIRLTRNGFRLRGQRLYLAKVGEIGRASCRE